jgi:isocitrate dehydrogenase
MGSEGLNVPDDPIIPYIEGDGIGPDIWAAAVRVFDAAVEKAYEGGRSIAWTEVLAGEKAYNDTGDWLPDETVDITRPAIGCRMRLSTPLGSISLA